MPSQLFRGISAAAALAFASFAVSATAQPTEVEIADDKAWEHQWTEMVFPPEFGPFTRTRVSAFEDRETNMAGSYTHDHTSTILTLYIYRPGNPSTSIWFDRALVAIGARDSVESGTYGEVDLDDLKIRRFVPVGGSEASGLAAVLAVEGSNVRSTGVALYRAGEWLVKIRISSRGLDVPEMDRTLKTVYNEMPSLADIDLMEAQFIAPCDAPPASGAATMIEDDLGLFALEQAVTVSAMQLPESEQPEEGEAGSAALQDLADLAYCRDGARSPRINVFRPRGGSEGMTVAIGDSGFSIDVTPDIVAGELNPDVEDTFFAVRTANGLEFTLHRPFQGLPNLDQLVESVNGQVIAKVSRPLEEGEGGNISLAVTPE